MLKGRASDTSRSEESSSSGVGTRGLLDRLARLRSTKTAESETIQSKPKASTYDSPRYLPRKPLNTTNANSSKNIEPSSNTLPASPTFNRRRLFLNNNNNQLKKQSNPIGVQSPKYFPKSEDGVANEPPVRQPNFNSSKENNESALTKERERIEFLQNYLADLIKSKEEVEEQLRLARESEGSLRTRVDELEGEILTLKAQKSLSISNEISETDEIKKLKETIRLLELERSSTQNVCQKAIQVLDSKADRSYEALVKEVEKLRSREQHFKEANEIFQQKLKVLTEENRRLRGLRPNQIF